MDEVKILEQLECEFGWLCSWKIKLYESKEECEHLIKLGKPYLERSRISDKRTGKGIENSLRTSSERTLRRGKDKIIKNIEQRIPDIISIPVENGEGLQVIHYGVGQKFVPHYDSRSNESFWNGGPRVATFLMYLSDVEEGGETVFPSAKPMKFSSNPYI
ncbi:prolyl 4-hydroxylase subunit alpha-like protein [Medicago truncatula]|uniref:Prolyl 4-hydroxylase subunit alpha-like protein n=1 Tax=Medicago truncatula TaxID=3880 RepID=G7IXK3_MEDTR|nr:prolyl 4-hydroxylase subunit alpha-like protein [Medicago truncatula]